MRFGKTLQSSFYEPWQDKFLEVARETLTPFFGTDILAGTIFEVVANKTDTGRPVYKENDDFINIKNPQPRNNSLREISLYQPVLFHFQL